MDKEKIRMWVQSLEKSFGKPRRPVPKEPLRALHEKREFMEMFKMIQKSLGLDILNMRVGFVNSGGADAPAWVRKPAKMPLFGSKEFETVKITVFLRKSFLSTATFETVVLAISHELSHIVLDCVGQEFRNEEKVVDLTAIALGYCDFYLKGSHVVYETSLLGSLLVFLGREQPPPKEVPVNISGISEGSYTRYGYLSFEEIQYAISLMRK